MLTIFISFSLHAFACSVEKTYKYLYPHSLAELVDSDDYWFILIYFSSKLLHSFVCTSVGFLCSSLAYSQMSATNYLAYLDIMLKCHINFTLSKLHIKVRGIHIFSQICNFNTSLSFNQTCLVHDKTTTTTKITLLICPLSGLAFIVNMAQPRVTSKEGISVVEILRSFWPVGIFVGELSQLIIYAGGLHVLGKVPFLGKWG